MRTSALSLAVAAALTGCGVGKQASPQPPASATGFLAVVSAGSTYKLYLPARTSPTTPRARLAVVDPTAPAGASGLLGFVDLGPTGAPQAVGASGLDVVAADVSTPVVYFVDAGLDQLKGTAALPAAAEPILSSDNASYSMGVAVDARRRKAWLSVSYGLLEYDLDGRTLASTVAMPVPENFSYDPASQRIVAPFYLCDPVASPPAGACVAYVHPAGPARTDGVTVVDLAASPATTYSLVKPAADDPQSPLGLRPDAVGVDFSLGVAVVAVEDPSSLQVLDLHAATYYGAGQTCQVPALVSWLPMPGPVYTEVAVDAVTHLALAAQEYGDGVVFVDLGQAKQGTVVRLDATMPRLPNGDPWVNRGDPHGAVVGLVDGRPDAFLASRERDWIARIDLQGVAAAMAGTGTFAAQVAYISVPAPP